MCLRVLGFFHVSVYFYLGHLSDVLNEEVTHEKALWFVDRRVCVCVYSVLS